MPTLTCRFLFAIGTKVSLRVNVFVNVFVNAAGFGCICATATKSGRPGQKRRLPPPEPTRSRGQAGPARARTPKGQELMRLPIDTSAMDFIAAGAPAPDVEFGTDRPRTDPNGVGVFVVNVMAAGEDTPEVIRVRTAGEPKGISLGAAVRLVGLCAQPYSIGDRSGVSFRATAIERIATATPSAARVGEGRDKP